MNAPTFASHLLAAEVEIREVGPRDGLQVERPLDVDDRVALIRAVLAAGVKRVEVGAFVSERAVPAMARTRDVLARARGDNSVTFSALVPNLHGAREAFASGVDEVSVTLSASERYGRRNTNMTLGESLEQLDHICRIAGPLGVRTDAIISCAFGSPYDDGSPAAVARIAEQARSCGCDRVTFADTTGVATPRHVDELVREAGCDAGMHFHDASGSGLANVFAGLVLGIRRFDTALGGLGGSPFADSAAGNVATEDVATMLDGMNVQTGIDLTELHNATILLRDLVGHPLPGRVAARSLPATHVDLSRCR